jgi:hypothetical protein
VVIPPYAGNFSAWGLPGHGHHSHTGPNQHHETGGRILAGGKRHSERPFF